MSRIDVEAVKRAYPLTDLVAHRYGLPLRPAGHSRWKTCCPLPGHDHDRDPSFIIYADQDSFYCYGCSRGGDVITLVQAIEGLDFRTAVDYLTAGRPPLSACHPAAPPPTRPPPLPAATADPAARDALDLAVDFYARRLRTDAAALVYLRQRGLSPATIARRRLGLAGSLADYLAWQRLPRRPFCQLGLLRPDGQERLAGRIVLPELVDGRPTWLIGRLLPDAAARLPDAPRYESLPGPRPLLGLGSLPPGCDRAVLVEGPFDHLLLCEWGYPSVALGGTAGSPAMLAALSRFRRVVLLLDRDEAGARATAELAAALGERAAVGTLPDGVKDVGELATWPDGRQRLATALTTLDLAA